PTLTAVALHHGRTPDALRTHHKAVADFPSVRILPETDLEAARADLEDARTTLAQAWDTDAVRLALEDVDWNKDAPLDGADVLDRVGAFARGEDPDALAWALACSPDAIAKHARKTGGGGRTKADRAAALEDAVSDPGIEACGALQAAVLDLDLAFTRAFVLEVDAQIAAIKERRSQLTFADLISRLHGALHDPATSETLAAGIRHQFSVALIDEFQDTDPLQYAIFKTAFQGVPLYFVGDPKQAIYAFRGADVHAYLGAQREADRRFTLGTNWRSTAGLVDAVNAVFAAPDRAFLFDGIPFRPVASSPSKQDSRLEDGDLPPLVWWPAPMTEDGRPLGKGAIGKEIPPLVATEIARLLGTARLEGEPLSAGDIAVLVPTRFEAGAVLEALQDLGVPAVVSRANDVRQSAVMADVELILRAVLRPDDERARRAALSTELWGWSAHEIAALDDAPERETEVVQRLREGQRQWRRTGVLGVLVEFQHAQNVVERLLGRPDGERMVTDLRHVAELLHEIETSGARSPENLMHWVRNREDQALPSREMKELRLERDADAVTITTHHNSKGLEYEIVFLPYLWSLSQRDYQVQRPTLARTEDGVVYDLGSDALEDYDRMRQADALAENVRKAYVAMTRARERCYVVWGRVGSGRWRLENKSSLGYLLAGHRAPNDGSLADHVEAARKEAAVDNPFDAVLALDPDGTTMRIVQPPRPGSVARRADASSRSEPGQAAALGADPRGRIT
ncbi:UvrD-helicase domain-containing protein, partial [Rubrivirga sp.]|uniref:UvrD-helicase domain-containing protein n=1 Tax=Rubrivirga sp. TaxID=1885344 RepID=UPI003C7813CB